MIRIDDNSPVLLDSNHVAVLTTMKLKIGIQLNDNSPVLLDSNRVTPLCFSWNPTVIL